MNHLTSTINQTADFCTPKGAELLKFARKYRGYTQAESAANYGIEERTLRRWENEEFNPRWNDVIGLIEDVYALEIIKVMKSINEQVCQ